MSSIGFITATLVILLWLLCLTEKVPRSRSNPHKRGVDDEQGDIRRKGQGLDS